MCKGCRQGAAVFVPCIAAPCTQIRNQRQNQRQQQHGNQQNHAVQDDDRAVINKGIVIFYHVKERVNLAVDRDTPVVCGEAVPLFFGQAAVCFRMVLIVPEEFKRLITHAAAEIVQLCLITRLNILSCPFIIIIQVFNVA